MRGGADVTVGRLDPHREHEAITTASRAFWPDPLFGWFARDDVHQHRVLPLFFGSFVRDARRHGEAFAALDRDRLAGVACWLPPGTERTGIRRLRLYGALARSLAQCRHRREGLRLFDAVERSHPDEPHWYLGLLAVDPSRQGRGIGGALLAPMLDRCDEDLLGAYLETQKFENLAFYERFGFVVQREIRIGDSPTVWTMWRAPDPECV